MTKFGTFSCCWGRFWKNFGEKYHFWCHFKVRGLFLLLCQNFSSSSSFCIFLRLLFLLLCIFHSDSLVIVLFSFSSSRRHVPLRTAALLHPGRLPGTLRNHHHRHVHQGAILQTQSEGGGHLQRSKRSGH